MKMEKLKPYRGVVAAVLAMSVVMLVGFSTGTTTLNTGTLGPDVEIVTYVDNAQVATPDKQVVYVQAAVFAARVAVRAFQWCTKIRCVSIPAASIGTVTQQAVLLTDLDA